MKKIYLPLLIALFTTSSIFAQTQRLVLLEEFTQASCGPCAQQNPGLNTLLQANTDKVVSIKYQTDWPGTDPMNEQTQTWVGPRVSYYNTQGVPGVQFDGNVLINAFPDEITQTVINNEYNTPSPFSIKIDHSFNADYTQIHIDVTITAAQEVSLTNLKLHTALVEKTITFNNPPGTNGEKEFYNVMRAMYPNASGKTLASNWAAGESLTISYDQTVPEYIYDLSEIGVVAFIQQSTTKAVQQAGWSAPKPLPIDLAASTPLNLPGYVCQPGLIELGNFTFTNKGLNPVTAAVFEITIDGQSDYISWSGNVDVNAQGTVDLSSINLSEGVHNVVVKVFNVNGETELNNNNDISTYSVGVAQAAITAPITQTFESANFPSNEGWISLNPNADLEFSIANVGGFGNSSRSALIEFFNITAGNIDYIILPKLNLSAMEKGYLKFSRAYTSYDNSYVDGLDIEASKDCGATWTKIWGKTTSSGLSTAPNSTSAFIPTAAQWKKDSIDLKAKGLTGANEVVIRFKATSGYGNNLYLDDINVFEATSVGVNTVLLNNSVQVLPNPAANQCQINYTLLKSANVSLKLYNAIGELVVNINKYKQNAGTYTLPLNTQSLTNGVYMLQLADDNNNLHSQRLIIIK